MDELKAFLARNRITQRELGDAIGVTGAFVGMMVNGDASPSLATARALLAFCRSKEPRMNFDKLFAEKEPAT